MVIVHSIEELYNSTERDSDVVSQRVCDRKQLNQDQLLMMHPFSQTPLNNPCHAMPH